MSIGLLDYLIPKLSLPFSACKSSSADYLLSGHNLGYFLIDLSTKNDLYYTPEVRQILHVCQDSLQSYNFPGKGVLITFDLFCTKDIGHNKDFITADSNMMGDLSDLYTDL